jgi:hypothetical protein
MDRRSDGFAFNEMKYNPPGSADFVNRNFDVAYPEAWLAVDDRKPVLVEVPEIKGPAQILDEWGAVIVNINERTLPSKPYGKFALVKPGFSCVIPIDAARIELHSSKAKLLCRVETNRGQWPALDLDRRKWGHVAHGPRSDDAQKQRDVLLGASLQAENTVQGVRELVVAPVRGHRRKPDAFYERVERFCPGPRLDLFGRQRQGWTSRSATWTASPSGSARRRDSEVGDRGGWRGFREVAHNHALAALSVLAEMGFRARSSRGRCGAEIGRRHA